MLFLSLREHTRCNEAMSSGMTSEVHTSLAFSHLWPKLKIGSSIGRSWFPSVRRMMLSSWKMLYVTCVPGNKGAKSLLFCVLISALTSAPRNSALFSETIHQSQGKHLQEPKIVLTRASDDTITFKSCVLNTHFNLNCNTGPNFRTAACVLHQIVTEELNDSLSER